MLILDYSIVTKIKLNQLQEMRKNLWKMKLWFFPTQGKLTLIEKLVWETKVKISIIVIPTISGWHCTSHTNTFSSIPTLMEQHVFQWFVTWYLTYHNRKTTLFTQPTILTAKYRVKHFTVPWGGGSLQVRAVNKLLLSYRSL